MEKGFALLLFVFALPLSIPLPVPPGLTTIASMPLIFFSIQLLFNYDAPWLPNWVGRKTFKTTKFSICSRKNRSVFNKA